MPDAEDIPAQVQLPDTGAFTAEPVSARPTAEPVRAEPATAEPVSARPTAEPVRAEPAPTALSEYQLDVAGFTAAGGDETVQRVVTAISRVSKRLDGYYRDQFADLQIQRGDWGVLQTLGVQGAEGCSTPSALADVVGVSPSTMTHRLDLLAQRGLVERAVDPDNRTRSIVGLSHAGWSLFQQVIAEAEVIESGLLNPLSRDQQHQLADLLERLIEGLDPRANHPARDGHRPPART